MHWVVSLGGLAPWPADSLGGECLVFVISDSNILRVSDGISITIVTKSIDAINALNVFLGIPQYGVYVAPKRRCHGVTL